MTTFEEQHSVWARNPDPEWERRNNVQDMVLVDTLSLNRAEYLCRRLLMLHPDGVFWIKDTAGREVSRFENRPPIQSTAGAGRKRRALGARGLD